MMLEEKRPKKKVGSRRKAREFAVQALYQFDVGKRDLTELLSLNWIAGKKPGGKTRDYFEKILDGTLSNLFIIDEAIMEVADFDKMMPMDKSLLRFGAFSLIYEKDIPAVIIINEAIELTKNYGGLDAHKFVNGVLDGIRKKLIEKHEREADE